MEQGVAIGGFMGVGKSTIGRLLASKLEVPFVDLDAQVAAAAGTSVSEIFEAEGERGFRRREADAVDALLSMEPSVIALGGGTLHHGENLSRLQSRFFVVSLVARWSVLRRRLGADDPSRPLWADAERLYRQRSPGYDCADAVVDVSEMDPERASNAVMAVLPW